MASFVDGDFLLGSVFGRDLYYGVAFGLPVIDYHCHLDPGVIAGNGFLGSITDVWLGGDHYKWRAMRACGVGEEYVTGGAGDWEKFEKWAEVVPRTMRNPLYHWTHLELARVLGIDEILKPETAREIYECANRRLAEMRPQDIIRKFGVEVICTTDDPADTLEHHAAIAAKPFGTKVLPTWRPDAAVAVEKPAFADYMRRLGASAGVDIVDFQTLMDALARRHDFFAQMGCKLSDHGMESFSAEDFTDGQVDAILKKALAGKPLAPKEIEIYRSGMLHHLAVMDCERGWVQQFHVGVTRNNNSLMYSRLGPDSGYDAISDAHIGNGFKFLDALASRGKLAKTILYNLNPRDNAVLAVMCGCFQDVRFGAAWWFLDQEQGIRAQIDTLSSLGLLSTFTGMLTDSRSLMSYTRHEYFRRILCDILGAEIASGRLPASEIPTVENMTADICHRNAKKFFAL